MFCVLCGRVVSMATAVAPVARTVAEVLEADASALGHDAYPARSLDELALVMEAAAAVSGAFGRWRPRGPRFAQLRISSIGFGDLR